MVTTKHCSYGHCKNDSRLPDRATMWNRYGQKVFFVRFPGKKRRAEKCKRWIDACIVQQHMCKKISYETLTYDHYICSLHFVGENGPSERHPDPVPAHVSQEERQELENSFQTGMTQILTHGPSQELASLQNTVFKTYRTASYVELEIAEVLLKLSEKTGNL